MYSNPALIRFRSALRSAGVLSLIQSSPFYRRISSGYEARFDQAMMASLSPGMRVFDIGANIGYYTKKFAEVVGPSGEVHAFEPVPASAAKVRELQSQYPWIHVHQCAVADRPGELLMNLDEDSTSPTNRISFGDEHPNDGYTVPVITVDQMMDRIGVPSFMKVDVEGYEWHVIQGASAALQQLQLIHVFVEVHFSLLESRGYPQAAVDISSVLARSGYKCEFTDSSHLHAFRQ